MLTECPYPIFFLKLTKSSRIVLEILAPKINKLDNLINILQVISFPLTLIRLVSTNAEYSNAKNIFLI